MSALELNAEQAAIIADLGRDLVVSAGAGTGKTATMARRFARAVTADETGRRFTELERVLAITFTRKAAAELSERVRRVLVGEHEDGVSLARRIDEAWISTIDAFCGRVVRRHALGAGVDPGFEIIDDVRSGVMKGAALDRVLARARANSGDAAALIESYGDAAVRSCVADAYGRVRAMGADFAQIGIAESSLEDAAAGMLRAMDDLVRAIDGCGRDNATLQGNRAECARVRGVLEAAMSLPLGERAVALARELPPARLKAFRKATVPAEVVDAAEEAMHELRAAVTGETVAPLMEALKLLVAEFDVEYGSAKRAASLLDHTDVVLTAARLFRDRPEVAAQYRERFRLLMIDEFQDTSGVQMAVLGPLRDGDLCVVGDDKQSIYGFRYADVDVFRGVRAEIGREMPLSENFRSHPDVLAFVNEVFGSPEVFGDGLMPLKAHRDRGASAGWPEGAKRVEVLAVRGSTLGDRTADEAEAVLIAERIAGLVDAGVPAGDIVVLMRGMPGATIYASAIAERGVPVNLASGERFFTSPAVAELRALLRHLVVPADDEAAVSVLAGRFVHADDDVLLAMRRAAGRAALSTVLDAAADGDVPGVAATSLRKLSAFVAVTASLRERMSRMSVADLLRDACKELSYDLTLLASGADGGRQWRNVLKLIAMAAEWDADGRGDAGAFLDHLDLCERYADGERAAPLAGESSAVRIMSIHSAKGLEFPVVFYARAHRALGRDASPALSVERVDGCPLLVCRHPEDGSAHEGGAGPRFAEVMGLVAQRAREEELRLAYVACTRAKEALFVTGVAKGKDDHPGTGSVLGLLHAALGSPDGEEGGPWRFADASQPPGPAPATTVPSGIELPESFWVLPGAPPPPVLLPARVSFTSLSEHAECAYGFYVRRVLGLLPLPSRGVTATEVGSAVHAALEQVGRVPAGEAADTAVARAGLTGKAARTARACVDAYLASPTAAEVAAAQRVHREQPFSLEMEGTRLVGSVDLIAWTGDSALIVDYKTGAEGPTEAKLEHYDLQARCYAAAAFAAGARSVTVRLLWLPSCGVSEWSFAEAERDALVAGVREAVAAVGRDALVAGVREAVAAVGRDGYPVRPGGYDRGVCEGCPVLGGLCPVDRPSARGRS